jgi:hypothetical protein
MIGSDAETHAWMQARVDGVLKELGDVKEGVLDDAVHDAHAEAASEVNNAGLSTQVHYLLQQGWKPEDILFRARQAAEENQ